MAISCDPLRQNFKRYVVNTFFDKFNNLSEDTWFLSIGRPVPWLGGLTGDEETDVPDAMDSESTEADFWNNVIAHKQITKEDISLVIPKYDWISGKIYTPYKNNIDLYPTDDFVQFYVVVDDERVYKCIDNNYNSPSSIPPTHTDSVIRKMSDGYRWKFLFSIPESKRKFITNTTYDALNNVERTGYIPIEYVDFLKINDDRVLQWQTQQAAIGGSIDYVELKDTYKSFLITTNTLRSTDAANTFYLETVPAGATTIQINSPLLYGQRDYYKDMIFSVDRGAGEGQRRVITSYSLTAGGSGIITLDYPLTQELDTYTSTFSILPNIKILGNGSSYNNTINPNFDRADVTISFGEGVTSITGSNVLKQTYVDAINIINPGKNYTYADFEVVKGLTFVGLTGADINDIAEVIISPYDGHGANAPKELGAAAFMIVTNFTQNEKGKLTINNDYRQFGIIKNPKLSKKQTRLRLIESGATGSFTVGGTASQGITGVDGLTNYDQSSGNIVYWAKGLSGYTGSSELIVTGITGGEFAQNGVVYSTGVSFGIQDVINQEVAGTEARRLLKIKVSSLIGNFASNGSDFIPGMWLTSVGNPTDKIKNTRFTGSIYRWEPTASSLNTGYLYVEYPSGRPLIQEALTQTDYYLRPTSSITGTVKVVSIEEAIEGAQSVYDQTTSLLLSSDTNTVFNATTFNENDSVYGITGATTYASGKVMEWTVNTGATSGVLKLFNTQSEFFSNLGLTFNYNGTVKQATVVSVLHSGDFKYRSGELEYIQNTTPITRNSYQKEQIKVLFQF